MLKNGIGVPKGSKSHFPKFWANFVYSFDELIKALFTTKVHKDS
jgi:hypothetical protein